MYEGYSYKYYGLIIFCMVNELKDILERLHRVFWDNRNSEHRDTLMPISFACNLIYLVIAEIEGKCETHANGK